MAKQDNDLAQYILEFIYRKDDGVIQSYKQSIMWYKREFKTEPVPLAFHTSQTLMISLLKAMFK